MEKRFYLIKNVGIKDELTGEIFSTEREYVLLLNKMNNKADALVNLLLELQEKRRECKYE